MKTKDDIREQVLKGVIGEIEASLAFSEIIFFIFFLIFIKVSGLIYFFDDWLSLVALIFIFFSFAFIIGRAKPILFNIFFSFFAKRKYRLKTVIFRKQKNAVLKNLEGISDQKKKIEKKELELRQDLELYNSLEHEF